MNIEELIKNVSIDTDIYFHEFEQHNDVIVAKSHFFDFYFGPTYVEVIDRYVLPGPIYNEYIKEVLPFRIDYIVDNYYNILVDTMNEIHSNCIGAEYRDEEEE